MVGWNWSQHLKIRKFNEMRKCGKLEHESENSRLWVVRDIIGLEKFFRDEGIDVRVRSSERITIGSAIDTRPGRVEILLNYWW